MPKIIISEKTMPIALYELDKWQGKLTWDTYRKVLAEVLGEQNISRHTLLSHEAIVQAYNNRKAELKDLKESEAEADSTADKDVTLEFAKAEMKRLEAEVNRLKREIDLHRQQFVRWQHNLNTMPGVDMERLNQRLDTSLPEITR
jgi:CRISPR/Cas system-associated endonuclease/helicase Cas3